MSINHCCRRKVIFSNGIAPGTLVRKEKAFKIIGMGILDGNEVNII